MSSGTPLPLAPASWAPKTPAQPVDAETRHRDHRRDDQHDPDLLERGGNRHSAHPITSPASLRSARTPRARLTALARRCRQGPASRSGAAASKTLGVGLVGCSSPCHGSPVSFAVHDDPEIEADARSRQHPGEGRREIDVPLGRQRFRLVGIGVGEPLRRIGDMPEGGRQRVGGDHHVEGTRPARARAARARPRRRSRSRRRRWSAGCRPPSRRPPRAPGAGAGWRAGRRTAGRRPGRWPASRRPARATWAPARRAPRTRSSTSAPTLRPRGATGPLCAR